MRLSAAFVVLLLLVTGCYDSETNQQSNVAPKSATPSNESPATKSESEDVKSEDSMLAEALAQVQAGTALLVDVRTDKEWNEAHFETAKHISIDKITEDCAAAFEGIKKEQTVFLH